MVPVISDITPILRDILRDVLCDSDIAPTADTRFEEIAGWDPMDLVTVVVEVECRLDVAFELPEIERLSTVGDLLAMIAAKRATASA